MKDEKLRHIIRDANTLQIQYNEDDLKKVFNGNFEDFTKSMQEYFGKFDKKDKVKEIARGIDVDFKGKSKWDLSERTWKVKDKSLTIRARYNYHKVNELLELMGYTGDKV